MCVGGRLRDIESDNSQSQPIIFPKKQLIARLIFYDITHLWHEMTSTFLHDLFLNQETCHVSQAGRKIGEQKIADIPKDRRRHAPFS